MASDIRFTQTVLLGKNKEGNLTPDAEGYYTMPIGGLNVYNSKQEYYVAKEALKLFESSSSLMRRIKSGALYAEMGHPVKPTNMTFEDFYRRILQIDQQNVCAHIKEVWLDMNYGKQNPQYENPDLIAIFGKVKPTGPKASMLESALSSPSENPAFSIRGLTENKFRNSRMERELYEIVTWDYVLEPGLNLATKWNSPTLEELNQVYLDQPALINSIRETLKSPVATESSRELAMSLLQRFNTEGNKRLYKW